MCQMCQMPNIWHTKHQKTPHSRCFKCCKYLAFVSVPLQICNSTDTNAKTKIMFFIWLSLSSHFFNWFLLSLLTSDSSSSLNRERTHSTSSNNKLQGKVAIITGGASGMGEDMTREFVAHDARAIVIVDVQDEKGQNAAVSCRLGLSDLTCHHLAVIWDFGMVLWIWDLGWCRWVWDLWLCQSLWLCVCVCVFFF